VDSRFCTEIFNFCKIGTGLRHTPKNQVAKVKNIAKRQNDFSDYLFLLPVFRKTPGTLFPDLSFQINSFGAGRNRLCKNQFPKEE